MDGKYAFWEMGNERRLTVVAEEADDGVVA